MKRPPLPAVCDHENCDRQPQFRILSHHETDDPGQARMVWLCVEDAWDELVSCWDAPFTADEHAPCSYIEVRRIVDHAARKLYYEGPTG